MFALQLSNVKTLSIPSSIEENAPRGKPLHVFSPLPEPLGDGVGLHQAQRVLGANRCEGVVDGQHEEAAARGAVHATASNTT